MHSGTSPTGQTGTRVVANAAEVFDSALMQVDQMKDEALIFVPGEEGVKNNREFFARVAARAQETGARVRILARFSKDEVKVLKKMQAQGLQLKRPASRDQFYLAIGVYDRKWACLAEADPSAERRVSSGIMSTDRKIVDWVASVFDMVWDNAIPFEDATAEVEKGIEPPRLRIFRDRTRVPEALLQQIARANHEVMLLLPTVNAFHRLEAIGVMEAIKAALDRGVRASVLTPLDSDAERALSELAAAKALSFRRISTASTANTVTVLVVDRLSSLVIEEKDASKTRFEDAIGDATYSNRNSTVLANVRFFERMWAEVEFNEMLGLALSSEKNSRRSSELFQDILAHDIRNYNQVSKLSAELLKKNLAMNLKAVREAAALTDALASGSPGMKAEARALAKELQEDLSRLEESDALVNAIVRATEGSSELTERAKKLGKIVSRDQLSLVSTDLGGSISRSIALVAAAHPEKTLVPRYYTTVTGRVLADEMLDEAFTNIISNSVAHTEGTEVPLEIGVEKVTIPGGRITHFVKVSISDHGKGIPDPIKAKIFTRYLKAASGTGLGLAIVHALAVERYSGGVSVSDRVKGDHTKGTTIEVWLQEAP